MLDRQGHVAGPSGAPVRPKARQARLPGGDTNRNFKYSLNLLFSLRFYRSM